jgi:hypothetical protein
MTELVGEPPPALQTHCGAEGRIGRQAKDRRDQTVKVSRA